MTEEIKPTKGSGFVEDTSPDATGRITTGKNREALDHTVIYQKKIIENRAKEVFNKEKKNRVRALDEPVRGRKGEKIGTLGDTISSDARKKD